MTPSPLPTVPVTAVERLPTVSAALGADVWIKREDQTHPQHGGNKIRKLVPILERALNRGGTDLLTIGAVGSHHVLATARRGQALKLPVYAALVPHPRSPRVETVLAATVDAGAHLYPTRNEMLGALRIGRQWLHLWMRGRRPIYIPPGGTNVQGSRAYLHAGLDLARQINDGCLPRAPAAQFCVLGSGGTAAGLVAAQWLHPENGPVIAVQVYPSRAIGPTYLRWLAGRALKGVASRPIAPIHPRVETRQLGACYGAITDAALAARALFAQDGIWLDTTYTAKAAAALMDYARGPGRGQLLLYWHTVAESIPGPPLARVEAGVSPEVLKLMR